MTEEKDYWIYRAKGLYDAWRHVPFPTGYPAFQTSVTVDVLEAGLIYAITILAISFLLVLPGFRKAERFTVFVRIVVGIFVLASTLLCNFGQGWEVSDVLETKTQYRAGLSQNINASISVKIGLRGVNITLKGYPRIIEFVNEKVNETIDYNERLSWDNDGWTIGRLGFGPYAGRFNQEFLKHQLKGSPYPILWIAEYFTLDGGDFRWGRYYLQAGYFTHIMLWSAFAFWILALILFQLVLRYGGYASLATGLLMIVGNILYITIRNPNKLQIYFDSEALVFDWGWCFWLCLFTGIFCVLIGILVVVLDEFAPKKLVDFFGVDFAKDLDEIYLDPCEIIEPMRAMLVSSNSPVPGTSESHVEMPEEPFLQDTVPQRTFRRRSVLSGKRFVLKQPPPPKFLTQANTSEDDGENITET